MQISFSCPKPEADAYTKEAKKMNRTRSNFIAHVLRHSYGPLVGRLKMSIRRKRK